MMTFTITNAPCSCTIAAVLDELGYVGISTELITDNTWVIRLPDWQAVPFVEACQEADLRVHAGTPRSLTTDPTFAIAAQHLEVRR